MDEQKQNPEIISANTPDVNQPQNLQEATPPSSIYPTPFEPSNLQQPLEPQNSTNNANKKSNKLKFIMISLVVIILITVVSYAVYSTANNRKTSSNSGDLVSYNVSSGNPSYSIDFYQNSKINTVGGQIILQHIKSPYFSAYISVVVDSQPNNRSCAASDTNFAFYSSGNKGLGCFSNGGTDGYVNVNGQNYQVILLNSFGISLKTTEAIFNSVVIK